MKKKEGIIQCHLCNEVFQPHECINTDKYDGEVKCPNCKALLSIKLVKGKLEKRKFVAKDKKDITKDITLTAEDYEEIARAKEKNDNICKTGHSGE